LDPHTTQRTVSMTGSYETSSYHCRVFRHMRSSDIDPSVCFCFLCSDEAAFNDLCARLQTAAASVPPLVSVSDAAPAHIGFDEDGEDEDWDS